MLITQTMVSVVAGIIKLFTFRLYSALELEAAPSLQAVEWRNICEHAEMHWQKVHYFACVCALC